ncbi:MAG: hypothetical protein U0R72_07200 [Nakamurella multipartita]
MALTDPTGGRKLSLPGRRHRGRPGAPAVLTVVQGSAVQPSVANELPEIDGVVMRLPAGGTASTTTGRNVEPAAADRSAAGLAEDCEDTIEFSIRQFRDQQDEDLEVGRTVTVPPASTRGVRRTWSDRYARKLFLTDLICLIWAAFGVHIVAPPIPTRFPPSRPTWRSSPPPRCSSWSGCSPWTGPAAGTAPSPGTVPPSTSGSSRPR